MYFADTAFPLCAAAIGLALFLYGFGSGGKRKSSFHGALLIGLAGAVIFIASLVAVAPIVPRAV